MVQSPSVAGTPLEDSSSSTQASPLFGHDSSLSNSPISQPTQSSPLSPTPSFTTSPSRPSASPITPLPSSIYSPHHLSFSSRTPSAPTKSRIALSPPVNSTHRSSSPPPQRLKRPSTIYDETVLLSPSF